MQCIPKKILIFSVLIIFTGCAPSEPKFLLSKHSELRLVMGTEVHLDFCHEDVSPEQIKDVYNQVWSRLEEIHWRMSIYDLKSDVNKVNHSYPEAVTVPADTYHLLEESQRIYQLTKGFFDITVYPLMQLWKESEENNRLPTEQQIKQVKAHTGMENVVLMEGNRVGKAHKDTQIDLGGIAKGYAIDEAARIFRENGFQDFLIDAGGDVYVGGLNCQRKPWIIGIRDPRDPSKLLESVKISNAAVATSGYYHRSYQIQGKQFSHIINPLTGYPQQQIVSATVVAPTATEADALATALSANDTQSGIQMIDSFGKNYAGLILRQKEDGQINVIKSQQYRDFKGK